MGSWLVIPEKGLYTRVLVVGAVGTGKTTACMYPFAQQILSWRVDDPGRRAGALVLEVKGDFCHSVRRILEKEDTGQDAPPLRGRDTGRSPGSLRSTARGRTL